uniref:Uncharacterized protein n=1 Tax=Glossina palpalis gambiensis TaxID=67801 RepID=A0A1B0AMM0_9MUSC
GPLFRKTQYNSEIFLNLFIARTFFLNSGLSILTVAENISPTPAAALGTNTNIVSTVHHSAYSKLSDMRNCPPAVPQRPIPQCQNPTAISRKVTMKNGNIQVTLKNCCGTPDSSNSQNPAATSSLNKKNI